MRTALLFLLCLTGCGYCWGRGGVVEEYQSICIPYVDGDYDGHLTNFLIREVTTNGNLRYQRTGGQIALRVVIRDIRVDNVGFRYDNEVLADRKNTVVPTETRITALAEVTVYETCGDCVVIGPDLVTAHIDFDHDFYSNEGGVNVFSLGQLNDLDLAEQEAYRPLYRELAKRIREHIYAAW